MTTVLAGLAPIFLLIVAGWTLRRRALVPDGFWPPAEKLTYHLFFPALLVDSTARADLSGMDLAGMGAALALAVCLMAAGVLLLRPLSKAPSPGYSSFFQGCIRPNSYVGLAIAAALYGAEGTALMAVGVIAVVPLVNVLAVLVLTRMGHPDGIERAEGHLLRATVMGVVRNPLILSVLAGVVLNGLGLHRVPVLSPLLAILGAAALPLGLLAVGAGLDLRAAHAGGRLLSLSVALKLAVLPTVTVLLAQAFGVEGTALVMVALYNGLPCSASSYVLARQMGGDHGLMAGIITAHTLTAALTLPVILTLVARIA